MTSSMRLPVSIRAVAMPMGVVDAMEFLIDKLKSSKNNADFFDSMNA